jgi:two-component system sensor histidine kinase DegS
MTDPGAATELSPRDALLESAREQLESVRAQLSEIALLVEQSQGEVDKLAERNTQITARLHQMQGHFETVPREDIRSLYEAAQDTQQRLFTMRGQLEKLKSDQVNIERYAEFLRKTIQALEGISAEEVPGATDSGALLVQRIIEAQEDERRKVSRLIHDGPAQTMANFILQTEIAMRLFDVDAEKARTELASLKSAAESSFSKIRDFIFEVRPMMLDDLGLIPTLRRYTDVFKEKSGLELNLVVTGSERRLAPHLEILIFRTLQSIFADIRDHAQATQVKVVMDMDEEQVRVSVEDNGRGPESDAFTTGDEGLSQSRSLATLEERINQVGGSLSVHSRSGDGSRVSFIVPAAHE